MHFLLTTMKVVYVLSTPCPEDGDDATVDQIRKRSKWENDDYIARGLILNGMSDALFDIYQNHAFAKGLWDSLETKYMSEDASSQFTQHKMNMDETIQVSSIIDKLPPSWKEFKHSLKHKKEELTLVELGSHLRIEESLRAHDIEKSKGNNVVGTSSINMVEHKKSTGYNDKKGKRKHQEANKASPNKKSRLACWKCGKSGHLKRDCRVNIGNKNTNGSGTSGSGNGFNNQNSKG
uniref:uncharacterized protein LOC122594907 n=1 Tax=Erigeron canadensis TaxID=72917 RepID=UPI001CB8B259|nr:uncharacterized protein LOC122594907 [Erigeron canadensis]